MNLGVDYPRAAVVAIDLHRGHLDMAVATMPTTPEVATRIIAANKRLFDWCRSVGIPVIHQVTSYRDADGIVFRVAAIRAWSCCRVRRNRVP